MVNFVNFHNRFRLNTNSSYILMETLLHEIKQCKLCVAHLPLGTNPVVTASKESKIVIIGQAPGAVVHSTGIPWDDKSGDNLRSWLGVSNEEFYNPNNFALVPMGFCYPGKGKTGDLPPRKECAPQWHELLLSALEEVELIILIGAYAQTYYLKDSKKRTLTETVNSFKAYLPHYFVLPHPSPRNNIWMKKNPWFKQEVLKELKVAVKNILNA